MFRVANSFHANIWIAGPISKAKRVCAAYCDRVGLCVTITPTTYIFTGGSQEGMLVRLINYPRFPTSSEVIRKRALVLAEELRAALGQDSFTVEFPDETRYYRLEKP